ncbi:MAG TPA: RNA polymerase sigma factor [Candidatus Aquilonibacter sp.]|nr:RNA polymerase sigma factor [Candidatus Aquilonibacter sp.]
MPDHEHLDSLADELLLRNVGQGCADCFALLFHRYVRQVFSVSYRIVRDKDEAEDILQEVFLSIYLQQERFDPSRGSVRTWILQFAYFKALLRRRYLSIRNFYKQEEISEAREIRSAMVAEPLGLSSVEWARFVEKGITALNAKQRQVIELVHFEGHTLQESSEILRESLANTRNYYYRGLKALRTFLNARVEAAKAQENAILEDFGNKDAYRW